MILLNSRHRLLVAGVVIPLGLLAGCGGGGSSPTSGGDTEQPSFCALTLPVGAMTFDKNRNMIYLSVPDTGDSHSNTVTEVDPVAGTVGRSVFVGSDPGLIVVSDDGQYVYVAVDGGIRRVDTSSMTADMLIDIWHEPGGQLALVDTGKVLERPGTELGRPLSLK